MTQEPANPTEPEPFIPYADIESITDSAVGTLLDNIEARLGFLPNSYQLYLHRPHLLRDINRLNNSVMRHPDSLLSEEFKYRLALLVSRNHSCRYCTAHEVNSLKVKWGVTDDRIGEILRFENPEDEREAAAWAFADASSRGPEYVTDDIRALLAKHFSAEEVVEIACTIGFWSLFTRIHSSLDIPLESHLQREAHWVDAERPPTESAQ